MKPARVPRTVWASLILLLLLAGCALLAPDQSGAKYAYIEVKDAYAFTDGGSIYLSLQLHERPAVGEDLFIWLNTPFGSGRLPNRIYCNGKLVEYGSPEEDRVLAVVALVATPEEKWPDRRYLRFTEQGTRDTPLGFGREIARIKAAREEIRLRLASTNLEPAEVECLQDAAADLEKAPVVAERRFLGNVKCTAERLLQNYLEAKAHGGVIPSRALRSPAAATNTVERSTGADTESLFR